MSVSLLPPETIPWWIALCIVVLVYLAMLPVAIPYLQRKTGYSIHLIQTSITVTTLIIMGILYAFMP